MQTTPKTNGRKTAAPKLSPKVYGQLLAKVLPARIDTEKENRRLLAEAESLIEKGEGKSLEENRLLDLLVQLIHEFEQQFYQPKPATPLQVLRELMVAREMKQSDVWKLFGSKSIASEVIKGKREITIAEVRTLANYFHVSPEVFI